MASSADFFLKSILGEDFLQSLEKTELWKPGTKSTIDPEELRTALQIVPRTIMALLIRELAPMKVGGNHRIQLPVPGGATLNVTKHERDVYSGDINQAGKVIVDFKLRALPGIGLVVMSAFELYDMENLINGSQHKQEPVQEDLSAKVQKLIDERMALHDLIGKVVDKKIMEKDAVHQLVLRKLTEMMERKHEHNAIVPEVYEAHREIFKTEPPKKTRPLAEFLEKSKKKHEYSIIMKKSETVDCPDCGHNIFNGKVFAGCICLGDDMERKIFIKNESDGIKVRFSKGWDEENIEMLLEVLRKKRA